MKFSLLYLYAKKDFAIASEQFFVLQDLWQFPRIVMLKFYFLLNLNSIDVPISTVSLMRLFVHLEVFQLNFFSRSFWLQ